MEVHAHTHTPRKKWTHYFWEFLMLFLAVFCGFLAENKREHIVEAHRAKEYARLLVEDIKKDTAEVKAMNHEVIAVMNAFDSIKSIVHKGIIDNKVKGSFYYYSRIGSIVPIVTWNDAAITQIIQSGNLRYFNDAELVKKISYYYAGSQEIDGQHEADRMFREKIVEIRNRVLNNYYFSRYSAFSIDGKKVNDSLLTMLIPLQQSDPDLLNEYANSFENRRATLRNLSALHFQRVLNTADELMILIKKEYHLK